MNMRLKENDIKAISVISSSICNLNCSFCYLHKNKIFKDYDKIIREAWDNGTYIDNIYKTVIRYPSDPKEVTAISLWGGETLIHIEDITKNIPKFFEYFPNISIWASSTNWVIDIPLFFNFLCELDKYAKKPLEYRLQLSIDGPQKEYGEVGHNVSIQTYKEKLKQFLDLVNQHHFNNLSIVLTVNSTVSKELFFKNFSNIEKFKEYFLYFYDLTKFYEENALNRALNPTMNVATPYIAQPMEITSEEGQQFVQIAKNWEKLRNQYFPDVPIQAFIRRHGLSINNQLSFFDPNIECSELNKAITITPEGGICECSGSYIDHFNDYKNEIKQEGLIKEYKIAKMRDSIYYKPAEMTDKEIYQHDWYIKYGYKNTSSTNIQFLFSLAQELLLSGQISAKYNDKELLLKHLFWFLQGASCPKINVETTFIPYYMTPSILRCYLNGYLDYAEDLVKNNPEEFKWDSNDNLCSLFKR